MSGKYWDKIVPILFTGDVCVVLDSLPLWLRSKRSLDLCPRPLRFHHNGQNVLVGDRSRTELRLAGPHLHLGDHSPVPTCAGRRCSSPASQQERTGPRGNGDQSNSVHDSFWKNVPSSFVFNIKMCEWSDSAITGLLFAQLQGPPPGPGLYSVRQRAHPSPWRHRHSKQMSVLGCAGDQGRTGRVGCGV